MKKIKINFNNPWFVTLISTMIGIIAGLYITSYFQKNEMYNAKEKALVKVKKELQDNALILKDFHDKLSEKYEPMSAIFSNLNEHMDLVIPKDSLKAFLEVTDLVFAYDSLTTVSKTKIELHGDVNFNFDEVALFIRDLSDILWSSYKETNYIAITDFDCIARIETFYVLQEEVNRKSDLWKNLLYKTDYVRNSKGIEEFMDTWRILLFKQQLLLELYESIEEVFEDCK